MATTTAEGYWGPVTSSIEWCEENHEVTPYIAEFWNTVSNIGFVLVGLHGLYRSRTLGYETRYAVLYVLVVVVGLGSMAFHATLQHIQQQSDETPMVLVMLAWWYCIFEPDLPRKYHTPVMWFLCIFGALFTVVHFVHRFVVAFQLFFAGLTFLCLWRLITRWGNFTKSGTAKTFLHLYWQTLIVATACWLSDLHLCHHLSALPVNPQGHAWWHLFMAAATYLSTTFMQFVRAEHLGWEPEWRRGLGGILLYPQPTKGAGAKRGT